MTEHVETFFKTVVFGGIALGIISLGLGVYYEMFKKVGKRERTRRTDQNITQKRTWEA